MAENKLTIYSDASFDYDSGLCGYSFLILKNQKIIHNFSGLAYAENSANAELFAIIRALEYLKSTRSSKSLNRLNLCIFVDCLPITQKSKVKWSDFLFNYLNALRGKFKTSEIIWVKGHSENRFNNLVDKNARKVLRDNVAKSFYLYKN